ncbi:MULTISPECIES: RHS repeat-associated core domain-containing protein [Clostridium]|uniref:RHS repeat-associated core domain-containing protein n=1 Tax=Clostridium TaxID=1485 RepID=UPI0009BD406F|nr:MULTISPECIES: RHS repeat-associated core domain-containing protein [Clostridium]PJI07266.1 hypothetical protein CUB90_05040 [Clostridium sp. CT7]
MNLVELVSRYDAIGNPLNDGVYSYTWEMGRQLAGMSGNGQNITYKYNDSGIRTEKTVNGVATKYILDGSNVIYETDGTNKIYYTYDSAGKLLSMNLNGTEYYYIRNVQGDVIGLIDKAGTQVVSYTYDAWGKLISIDGSLKDSVGKLNPYRYRGYRYDSETGLYYLQSRYYNPEMGRFINADDIEELKNEDSDLLDYNRFAYCSNNPVNKIDDNGHFAWALIYFVPGIGQIAFGVTVTAFLAYGTYKTSSWAKHRIMYAKRKSVQNIPIGRANRKKQGREVNERKRKNKNFKTRSNKNPNRPMKKHTPSRKGHSKYF